nr:MAG TPA: hypothetical protein [Caudoviricetes sp.]
MRGLPHSLHLSVASAGLLSEIIRPFLRQKLLTVSREIPSSRPMSAYPSPCLRKRMIFSFCSLVMKTTSYR